MVDNRQDPVRTGPTPQQPGERATFEARRVFHRTALLLEAHGAAQVRHNRTANLIRKSVDGAVGC
jgi:hypothetical protein